MHGQGTFVWGDGRIYVGHFEDDKKNGRGTYLQADGNAYLGEWLDGKQHGTGYYVVYTANKEDPLKIKKGKWVAGKRQEWIEEVAEDELLK